MQCIGILICMSKKRDLRVINPIVIIIYLCLVVVGCNLEHSSVSSTPTPLALAIFDHNLMKVAQLLDSGADPNQLSSFGGTDVAVIVDYPLVWAARDTNASAIMSVLLDHGANPYLGVPLSAGVGYNALNGAIFSGRVESVKFLLQHGVSPDSIDQSYSSYERTPLLAAIVERAKFRWFESDKVFSRDSINVMKRFESQVNKMDFGDTSSIHRFAVYDTIIGLLLKYGASISKPDVRGETPLHTAADYCDSEWAEKLINLGASLTAKDRDSNTPEEIAEKNNCTSVIAAIRRHLK